MTLRPVASSLLLVLVACGDAAAPQPDAPAGCSEPSTVTPTATGDLVVAGKLAPLAGTCAPDSGHVYVLWPGEGPKGDFLFRHGEGAATNAAFATGVALPVPDMATFGDSLGVGSVILFDASVTLPEGIIDPAQFETAARGIAGQFAVVYKGPNPAGVDWADAFPPGLSCGKCVKAKAGDTFDTFAPVACSEVVLDVGPEDAVDVCNWI